MRKGRFLLILLLVSMFTSLSTQALAQCTDSDGDGFFRESGCGTGEDCNDADANTFPGASESCDGYDNDCDGSIDNDPGCDTTCDLPEKIGDDVRLTHDPNQSFTADVAWTASGYGVVWADARDFPPPPPPQHNETYFTRTNAEGQEIGDDLRLTNSPGLVDRPTIVWTGTEYGIVWSDEIVDDDFFDLYFARLDAQGNRIGDNVRVTTAHRVTIAGWGRLGLTWTGSQYGVVWTDGRDGIHQIYFARLDAQGNKIGADVRVTSDPARSWHPDIGWTGSEFGIVWADERTVHTEILFARLDSEGNKIGNDVLVSDLQFSSNYPTITWTGSEYGVAWEDRRDEGNLGDPEIYFARLDDTGSKIGQDLRVTNDPARSSVPRIVWTGSEYGVVWTDNRDGGSEIYFARLDPVGNKIEQELRLTNVLGVHIMIASAWSGTVHGIVWSDDRRHDGGNEIYFARLGCNCTDGDGDGTSVCNDCDDLDSTIWSAPSEVRDLVFAADKETLSWTEPAEPGAPLSDLVYDTLRSEDPGDFDLVAVCIESDDGSDLIALDEETPLPGTVFHYLVRAENACPSGEGSLGTDSDDVERTGRSCP